MSPTPGVDRFKSARKPPEGWLLRLVPSVAWLRRYDRVDLSSDLMAALTVAIMLVPQAMAYAMLAGLPPQAGLYASILPLVLYALLGTSSTLAVGPVAVVSLLVAGALGKAGISTPSEAMGLAAALAVGVGLIQFALGLIRAGFLANFLSHPVVSGFTSAAAVVIAMSQVKHALGIQVASGEVPIQTMASTMASLGHAQWIPTTISLSAIGLLLWFQRGLGAWLERRAASQLTCTLVPRMGALLAIVLGTTSAWALDLPARHGLEVVGAIPAGLPSLGLPPIDTRLLMELLPTMLAISFVGFLESFAVAQSLAAKRQERIEGSRELIALGAANLGAAISGGYPVTGGFSRSLVNSNAGARTGMASIFTAGLVALTLVGLTPLFYFLPKAVLAAIIIVAVLSLVDLPAARRVWRYSRADGLTLVSTVAGVFVLGIEQGILVGAGLSLVLYLWRSSRPHMAVVGRVGESEHFRNIERHDVSTHPEVLAIRIDENLYFGNVRHLEERMHQLVSEHGEVRSVLLICSGVNFIDSTGLDCLEHCVQVLGEAGITLYFAEVKGPVMDRLRDGGFVERMGPDRFHLSTHAAFESMDHSSEQPPLAQALPGSNTISN